MVDQHRSDRRQRLELGYPLTERYCTVGAMQERTAKQEAMVHSDNAQKILSCRPSSFSRPLTHHATGRIAKTAAR